MQQPKRVLDLFCGAGGAAMGLHQVFPEAEIVGVDLHPQPHYPFKFYQMDAQVVVSNQSRGDFLGEFDFAWASPPCQHYSRGKHWVRGHSGARGDHPDLIPWLQRAMRFLAPSWVIENVEGAPLQQPTTLCGSMFGLRIEKGYLRRHRLFESNFPIKPLQCSHAGTAIGVYGHGAGGMWGYRKANAGEARDLLGIDWMNREEMREAIPPAYSRYIAEQYLRST